MTNASAQNKIIRISNGVNKYHFFWILLWLVIFVYLISADTVPSGKLIYQKDFSKNQYGIGYIFPLGRTHVFNNAQTIIQEPVYFTVYTPKSFDKVQLSISFDISPSQWKIGYQVGPGFEYRLFDLDDMLTEQNINLHIDDAYYNKNRLRFMLANPSLPQDSALSVNGISVTLTNDEPFHIKDYFKAWKKIIYERIK